jgi:DNA-binding transcriptional MerR regulator
VTSSHTIGEVLNRLKEEFEDVTISKIRFLESEGLVAPERSESGYRQFSGEDVERLRYVLRAQRDRYLPLRVIKDELARLDAGLPVVIDHEATVPTEVSAPARLPIPPAPAVGADATLSGSSLSDVVLDARELAHAAGLSMEQLGSLVKAGVLRSTTSYDGDDLRIAKVAGELLRRGLEARHLRSYRLSADREEAIITALVGPLLRQRNPESRREAIRRSDELADLGARLQRLLLTDRLRAVLRS